MGGTTGKTSFVPPLATVEESEKGGREEGNMASGKKRLHLPPGQVHWSGSSFTQLFSTKSFVVFVLRD